jgi:hypothetical protein
MDVFHRLFDGRLKSRTCTCFDVKQQKIHHEKDQRYTQLSTISSPLKIEQM